jgi:hypothetical protein
MIRFSRSSPRARDIHLHIQAKQGGDYTLPDQAFKVGQRKPSTPITPDECAEKDFDPNQSFQVKPKIIKRKVSSKVELGSTWVSEVIGSGGRVNLLLGEFPTFRDAQYCSLTWSNDHPDDLRLTRER